ncbi:hypothetical protein BGZ63DRAFT_178886 [Mariannaea sp. PMI_226]|nr:hypothetical protein BGZ63DRAFT_178886 [Mariannaea sp. PMI_226]
MCHLHLLLLIFVSNIVFPLHLSSHIMESACMRRISLHLILYSGHQTSKSEQSITKLKDDRNTIHIMALDDDDDTSFRVLSEAVSAGIYEHERRNCAWSTSSPRCRFVRRPWEPGSNVCVNLVQISFVVITCYAFAVQLRKKNNQKKRFLLHLLSLAI